MLLYFTKMHGLGNDFVVIDSITQKVRLEKNHIQRIADRHLGVGCDQIILIEPPIRSDADFYFRIFNPDGKEVEQCGNGARCAVKFFYDNHFTHQKTLAIDCLAGSLTGIIEDNHQVTVNMGVPIFTPSLISFISEQQALVYPITIEGEELSISVVSMGNPHAILVTKNLNAISVQKLGALLSKHPAFPKETNVEFMQIDNKHKIQLKVFERGVGETFACGSGAAAAVVSGIQRGILESPVIVNFSKGELKITWNSPQEDVYQSGPATTVYMGRLCLS